MRLAAPSRRAAYALTGGALAVVGLAEPWLAIPLQPQLGPFALGFDAGPHPGLLAPGSAVLVLAVGCLALLKSGRRIRSLALPLAAALVVLPWVVVALAAVQNQGLVGTMRTNAALLALAENSFAYTVPSVGVPHASLLMVAQDIRLGAWASSGAGVLLVAACWSGQRGIGPAWRRVQAGLLAGGLAAVAVLLARPLWALHLAERGSVALQTGRAETGMQELDEAARWNSDLRQAYWYATTVSQGDYLLGGAQSPGAQLYLSSSYLYSDPSFALTYARQAEIDQPGSAQAGHAVLLATIAADSKPDGVQTAAPEVTLSGTNTLRDLTSLVQTPGQAGPVQRYLLARTLYSTGLLAMAQSEMVDVAAETDNGYLRSNAITYEALCEQQLGQLDAARLTLRQALGADPYLYNVLARSLALGLYTEVPP